MANNYFRFKQFTIWQDKCAMKVGTDGVLLGAWIKSGNAKRILDVGTGTGLIAIMIAQKTNALVDAIEIEKAAYQQAIENVNECPWKDQIQVMNYSLQDFAAITNNKYDLIVSNPPYFKNSLKSVRKNRNLARHDDSLTSIDLLDCASRLLNKNGSFYCIIPHTETDDFIMKAVQYGFNCASKLNVKPNTNKIIGRVLLQFKYNECITIEGNVIIEKENRHEYTDLYKKLTADYYLNF